MNLCKCLRCGKVLIDEEYSSHRCNQPVNGKIVKIYADYLVEGKHPATGEKLVSIRAIDGTAYWIIFSNEAETNKLPFMPSDESLQGDDPTNFGQNLGGYC